MSKTGTDKKAQPSNTAAAAAAAATDTCSFEGNFVSIGGSRLVVESDHSRQTSYAIASDALLTCDGKIGNEGTLKAGRRIRVTTRTGNTTMVTAIEWLHANKSFPALKTPAAK